MTADGVAVTKICDVIGCSRKTYYNWKNEGHLTDGKPWDEVIEKQEMQLHRQELEAEAEVVEDFHENLKMDLRDAIRQTMKAIKSNPTADAGDLEKLSTLLRRLENRGAELKQLQEEFMRRAMFAIREEVSEHKFEVIVERMKAIQAEQIKEFDAEFAKAYLD